MKISVKSYQSKNHYRFLSEIFAKKNLVSSALVVIFLQLLSTSSFASITWQAINDGLNQGNENILAFAIDPNKKNDLYASIGNTGLFKSINNGQSWFPIGQKYIGGIQIHAIAINPKNSSELYIGTKYFGVLKSIDGGQTWSKINIAFYYGDYSTVIDGIFINPYNPSQIFAVDSPWAVIYKSPSNEVLQGWSTYRGLGHISAPVINTKNQHQLYHFEYQRFYKSDNFGDSWQLVTSDADLSTPSNLQYTFLDNQETLFAQDNYYGPSALIKSVDLGVTWSHLYDSHNKDNKILSYLVGPKSSQEIWLAVKNEGLYHSPNGGKNWSSPNKYFADKDINSITANPNSPYELYITTKTHGLYHSPFKGHTWLASNQGMMNASVISFAINANTNKMYAGLYQHGLWTYSTDNKWHQVENDIKDKSVYDIVVNRENPDYITLIIGSSAAFSNDGGKTIQPAQLQNSSDRSVFVPGSLIVNPQNSNEIISFSTPDFFKYKSMWKSQDGGKSWHYLNTPNANYLHSLSYNPGKPNELFLSTSINNEEDSMFLYKSIDGGETWVKSTTLLETANANGRAGNASIRSIYMDKNRGDELYAKVVERNKIYLYKSVNGDERWIKIRCSLCMIKKMIIFVLSSTQLIKIHYIKLIKMSILHNSHIINPVLMCHITQA